MLPNSHFAVMSPEVHISNDYFVVICIRALQCHFSFGG